MSERFIPRDFTTEVIKFAAARNYAGLFLDPGLGKTGIALAIIKILMKYQGRKGALITAPIAVMNTTWPDEIAKWEQFNDFSFEIIGGSRRQRYKAVNTKADIHIVNPENLGWLIKTGAMHQIDPDIFIGDESTKFKNPSSVRFRDMIAHEKSEWTTSMLNFFTNRYILTGTPIPKGLMDIWSQVFLLDGGYHLGKNITAFRKTYFNESVYGNYRKYEPKDNAQQDIQSALSSFCIRKKAEDHIDMPEMLEYEVEIDLPPKIMSRYKLLESEFFVALDKGEVTAANAGVLTGKLQQFAQGAIYLSPDPFDPVAELKAGEAKPWEELHNEKLERLDLLLDQLEGQPVMIAYAFKHDAVRLIKYLKNRYSNKDGKFLHLGAGSKPSQFQDAKNQWNAKKLDVLLVQPSIVAHGLNIQYGGHHIIMFGNTWSFEDYDQLRRRLYRPGQPDAKVIIHRMVARRTVDVAMVAKLHKRGTEQESFVEALQTYRRQQKLAA